MGPQTPGLRPSSGRPYTWPRLENSWDTAPRPFRPHLPQCPGQPCHRWHVGTLTRPHLPLQLGQALLSKPRFSEPADSSCSDPMRCPGHSTRRQPSPRGSPGSWVPATLDTGNGSGSPSACPSWVSLARGHRRERCWAQPFTEGDRSNWAASPAKPKEGHQTQEVPP